jgi:acetylornithine aminotransferase
MATQAELLAKMEKLIVPNYGKRLRAMVRGRGARIWDADGNEYVDFFAGFGGAGTVGHCHPRVVAAVQKQAGELFCHGNFFTNANELFLADKLNEHAFGGKVFYCHSGAEANEAALKLVRLAARQAAPAGAPMKYKIISFHHCFHGRTMGGLSLTPERFQQGFEPMLPGNVKVDYGDLDAARKAIDPETAGVFVEAIQAEGGMHIPTVEFMQGLRKLCDEKGLLLVCDEVWTGPARTGKWFAHQHFGIVPDVMTLAKAIGGGAPVGVCLAAAKWGDVLGPGKHGCTMGGNPLCTAAAAEAIRIIEDEKLVQRAVTKGDQVMQTLLDAKVPCVKDIRGKGLMIGIQLDESKVAKDVFQAALAAGLFIASADNNVLRLAPPLVADDATLDKGMSILLKVLRA